ncbi:hypothetical protein K1719_033350 [Acacia pycnantha]|nr:hypothetical protein K1719_033350 [Acacia pycnantha]
MKFNVKAWSGGARAGVLEIGSCPNPIETPALLLSTRKGLPHFISPDLLSSLPSPDCRHLLVSPLHFMEGLPTRNISKIRGLPRMLSLHEMGLHLTKLGASFETPCGRLLIKPKDYMEMISHMGPNIWVALADEEPAGAGGCAFGTIVGGSNLEERKCCAEEVAKRNVSGYGIGGFGLGESIGERPPLLTAIMDILPDDKPRMISGLGLPGIATGIDLFDSAYVYSLTLGGYALTFSLDKHRNHYNMQLSQIGSDSTKINFESYCL